MEIIEITKNNIEKEHICCSLGSDKRSQEAAATKKQWMLKNFAHGLRFKRLNERGKMFVEYMPIETAHKPITGKNYMVIHCLWVSGKFKGKGIAERLLQECIHDSKEAGMDGVAVISSAKLMPFLTDKRFFLKHNFIVQDTAPPYFELLVLKWNTKAVSTDEPRFLPVSKKLKRNFNQGFELIYNHQCPFMEEYVNLLAQLLRQKNIPVQTKLLKNHQEVKKQGSPFASFTMYYNGEFQTHELMPPKKFEKFLAKIMTTH